MCVHCVCNVCKLQTSISNISRSSEEFVSHAVDHVPLSNQSKDSPKDSTRRFFVSPSGGYRASGIPASRKLSSILTESTFSDKSEGATRMMIRFPSKSASQLPDLHFPRNFEPTHPGCGSVLLEKSASTRCHGRLVNWYIRLTRSRFRNKIWCG